jgi:hypothetical protein
MKKKSFVILFHKFLSLILFRVNVFIKHISRDRICFAWTQWEYYRNERVNTMGTLLIILKKFMLRISVGALSLLVDIFRGFPSVECQYSISIKISTSFQIVSNSSFILLFDFIYRMSQEERTIFWEVIVSVILSQKIVYVHVSYPERFPR